MKTNINAILDAFEEKVNCPYSAETHTGKGLRCHITRIHPEINLP